MRRFFQRPNDSRTGACDVRPCDLMRTNAGDSASDSRTHTDTTSSTMDSRNGTRPPQSANAISPSAHRVPRVTSNAMHRPSVAVV